CPGMLTFPIRVLRGSCLLCLRGAAAARPPRSVPTRRSSDLALDVRLDPPVQQGKRPPALGQGGEGGIRGGHGALSSVQELLHPRSEEHTSELQSRENLVCRLLLEKKK